MLLSPDHLRPRGEVLRVGDVSFTAAALLDRARRHLGALAAEGVGPGETVAVWADGSVEFLSDSTPAAVYAALVTRAGGD